METLTIEVIKDENIELCRELCNQLMVFQKSKSTIEPERFDNMNFDTRMKKTFDSSLDNQIVVVKDKGIPVGYVFSILEDTENNKESGLYPERDNLPKRVGILSNLYFQDKYRGRGLGSKLFEMSMEWLENLPEVDLIFIYVSNGNDVALNFYLSRGFTFSHDVWGGFIKALYRFEKYKISRK